MNFENTKAWALVTVMVPVKTILSVVLPASKEQDLKTKNKANANIFMP